MPHRDILKVDIVRIVRIDEEFGLYQPPVKVYFRVLLVDHLPLLFTPDLLIS